MKFTTLTAKYPGTCQRCKQPINIGERIRYGGKGLTYHLAADCPQGTGYTDDPPYAHLENYNDPDLQPPTPYNRLPELDGQQPDETRHMYGWRAFNFILATGVTATVDTIGLEMADHVYPAIIGRAKFSDATFATLARTRRLIVDTLTARAKAAVQPNDEQPEETTEPEQPQGNGNARLIDPDDQPPAPPALMPTPTIRPIATIDADLF